MYGKVGYYLQMVAAFLLLSLTHYFASGFLPVADCDETFNFVEPIHYLLYESGKQTWEMCSQFALRSWLFSWMYAWPAVFIRGAASLSSADVYFYLRIFNGRVACLAELFFVYSVWASFSGKAAMVALLLLLGNYPITHAAVSVLPTSFVMICNFVVLGCWLRTHSWTSASAANATAAAQARTQRAAGGAKPMATHTPGRGVPRSSTVLSPLLPTSPTAPLHAAALLPAASPVEVPRHLELSITAATFFSVLGVVAGWPFAGLVAVPVGLDLLVRFPARAIASAAASLVVTGAAGLALDARYYCRWTLSSWNVVAYNVFGGSDRGPELFDVEPWFFFWKNLTLNFHVMLVAVMLAPVVVLCAPRRGVASSGAAAAATVAATATAADSTGSANRTDAPGRSVGAANGAELTASAVERLSPPTVPMMRPRLSAATALAASTSSGPRSPIHSTRHSHASAGATSSGGAGAAAPALPRCSRGRELLYMTPFFVWFVFWMGIAHKEERFMSPAYPFMVLAATRALCLALFPDPAAGVAAKSPARERASPAVAASSSLSSPVEPSLAEPLVAPPVALPAAVAAQAAAPVALAWRRAAGLAFLVTFFLVSCSRAMAVYTFYSGPERIFYDWYPVLQAEARRVATQKQRAMRDAAAGGNASALAHLRGTTAQQTQELTAYYTVCLGREWYRFPSSFFLDHLWTRYQFLDTGSFHGMLPLSFATPPPGAESGFLHAAAGAVSAAVGPAATELGACTCGAAKVNDLNKAIPEQFVRSPTEQCDVVFDSLSPPDRVSAVQRAEERRVRHLDSVFTRSLTNASAMRAVMAASGAPYRAVAETYAVLDVDHTPLWCRVLYYPFGVTRRCAVWRPLVLQAGPLPPAAVA